jgi:hypothetical protein
VVTKLGYEHLTRHGLRHTGLTWTADAGVPLHTLRKIAGHGTLTTTQRYLHPDRKSVTDAGDLRCSIFGPQKWSPTAGHFVLTTSASQQANRIFLGRADRI